MSDLVKQLREAADWEEQMAPYGHSGRSDELRAAANRIEVLQTGIIAAMRETDDNMRPILRAALHRRDIG